MGIFFNREPQVARRARQMLERGNSLYHVALLYDENTDPNETINLIAREGWELAHFQVVVEPQHTFGIYLFRRRAD